MRMIGSATSAAPQSKRTGNASRAARAREICWRLGKGNFVVRSFGAGVFGIRRGRWESCFYPLGVKMPSFIFSSIIRVCISFLGIASDGVRLKGMIALAQAGQKFNSGHRVQIYDGSYEVCVCLSTAYLGGLVRGQKGKELFPTSQAPEAWATLQGMRWAKRKR